MSSPIHHAKGDLDAALMYAPPWVRDQAAPVQRPSPTLPAPPSIRRIDGARAAFSGDRAMMQLQRELALNPEKLQAPPTDGARRSMPLVLRICALGGATALVAWALASVPGARKSAELTVPASFAPPGATNLAKKNIPTVAAQPPVPGQLVEASEPPKQVTLVSTPPAPLPPQIEMKQEDTSPVTPPQSAPMQAASAAVHLDSDEIATLIGRGKNFLAIGDFVSARLLLRRAAEAGSASAALMIGGTFDPLVQKQSAVGGGVPDIVQARQWYKKAAELGSDAASHQLANLAKMGP